MWTYSLYTNSGCGKREKHNNIWSIGMQRQHPLLELPWGLNLLALCQRTLGSERHRYTVAWPDKLGTDPMVCGAGKNIWTPPWTSGGIPWVSTRFSVSIENEQADTRRDSQICLAKPNSQARTGTKRLFPVQLTMNRIGNLTRLICTLLYVMTTHAYIYTVACTLNSRLLSGHLGVVAGTLLGFLFYVRYGSVGVQLTRLRALCQGALISECVGKIWTQKSYKLLVQCSNPRGYFFLFACLKRCFRLSLSNRNKKPER